MYSTGKGGEENGDYLAREKVKNIKRKNTRENEQGVTIKRLEEGQLRMG